jgi:ABC-type branched-subunit amino acid transport system substrate-binding protein
MRGERARWAALAAVVLAAAACGSSSPRPLRIGVIVDCVGGFRAMADGELAAAQLPLIARGGRPAGKRPSDGLEGGSVAGRRVKILRGCSESGEFSTLTEAARQLVEREGADVVVAGGMVALDGLPLRELARRYPRVPFVVAANGPREVTLQRPAGNLYRIAADYGQGVAGLATYAYRRLGWRTVAVMPDAGYPGWNAEAAFVREFCALGGRVERRQLPIPAQRPAKLVSRVPPDADGVAVLGSLLTVTPDSLKALARRGTDKLVLGPEVLGVTGLVRHVPGLEGVVAASYAAPTPDLRTYLREYARAYPGISAGEPRDAAVMNYDTAVEAVLRAFEQAHGDLSDGRRRLRARLAHLRTTLLGVPVRMDANRQAVVSASMVRLGRESASGLPELSPLQTVSGVDQSVGGLLPAGYVPTWAGEACRRAPPPPWAR